MSTKPSNSSTTVRGTGFCVSTRPFRHCARAPRLQQRESPVGRTDFDLASFAEEKKRIARSSRLHPSQFPPACPPLGAAGPLSSGISAAVRAAACHVRPGQGLLALPLVSPLQWDRSLLAAQSRAARAPPVPSLLRCALPPNSIAPWSIRPALPIHPIPLLLGAALGARRGPFPYSFCQFGH